MTDTRKGKGGKTAGDAYPAAYSVSDDVRADTNSRVSRTWGILTDAPGLPYQSVRFCDLDRFCDK